MRSFIHGAYKSAVEAVTLPQSRSTFAADGVSARAPQRDARVASGPHTCSAAPAAAPGRSPTCLRPAQRGAGAPALDSRSPPPAAARSRQQLTGEALPPPLPCLPPLQRLTPEEFVAAGDYLVHTCPTWAWERGDARRAVKHLPLDKQFLITRNGGRWASLLLAVWALSCMALCQAGIARLPRMSQGHAPEAALSVTASQQTPSSSPRPLPPPQCPASSAPRLSASTGSRRSRRWRRTRAGRGG